ncbi:MAG: rod shape-determining protein MreC, partial [Candidatus Aureabacteria bacterium]|nr:rod shape-determining protein MreC [Candidatus Auribacterota bacterium]
ESRIGGVVERTGEVGVVEGTSFSTCRLNYLPRQTAAQPGDRVLSSGMGGVYPRGLVIGSCMNIYEGEYGFYRSADVAPGADFARLREVFVLVRPREEKGDFLK